MARTLILLTFGKCFYITIALAAGFQYGYNDYNTEAVSGHPVTFYVHRLVGLERLR